MFGEVCESGEGAWVGCGAYVDADGGGGCFGLGVVDCEAGDAVGEGEGVVVSPVGSSFC